MEEKNAGNQNGSLSSQKPLDIEITTPTPNDSCTDHPSRLGYSLTLWLPRGVSAPYILLHNILVTYGIKFRHFR